MTISFQKLPASLNIPGAYVEIDSSNFTASSDITKVLLIGMGDSGTAAAKKLIQLNNDNQVSTAFGKDSELYKMYKAFRSNDGSTEVYGITPSQITVTNLDITPTIAAFEHEEFQFIATSINSGANLTKLTDELAARWQPPKEQAGHLFIANGATVAAAKTFGGTQNSPHLTIIPHLDSLSSAYEWAAAFCGVASKNLSLDPSAPLQSIKVTGLKAPTIKATFNNRNLDFLENGISSYYVNQANEIIIENLITSYQDDNGLIQLNTVATLPRIRKEQKKVREKYKRYKLAADGDEVPSGVLIVTPSQIKADLLETYQKLINKGWVQDFESYAKSLIVEINADDPKKRIDYNDFPILTGQFRILAGKMSHK